MTGRRAFYKAAFVAGALVSVTAGAPAAVLFHSALLRSVPKADARLDTVPKDIRLVFSEEVVPALSRITLIAPDGDSSKLSVANDPRDIRVLLGNVPPLKYGGRYTVYWQVVSADGHAMDGKFSFSITRSVVAPAITTPPVPPIALWLAIQSHNQPHKQPHNQPHNQGSNRQALKCRSGPRSYAGSVSAP